MAAIHSTRRIVLGSDLNHHGTLFAGQMAKWMVEACLIEAVGANRGRADNLVCVNIDRLHFKKPVNNGHLVEISTTVSRVGRTSLTVVGKVTSPVHGEEPILESSVTFVALDEEGRPMAHGINAEP